MAPAKSKNSLSLLRDNSIYHRHGRAEVPAILRLEMPSTGPDVEAGVDPVRADC